MAANKPNHVCAVCGRQYYACRNCDKRNTWKSVCDTTRCYQVYLTSVQYTRGMIDKDTARAYVDAIKLSDAEVSRFLPGIQDIIREVLAEDNSAAVLGEAQENTPAASVALYSVKQGNCEV